MPLQVAFLWHMHQPYYVDPIRGTALMPWVRLHATKGYLDMIWMVEQVPEFRCTFNLTPVLLKQIEELASQQVKDLWYELAAAPADSLTADQKCNLLEHFFKANRDHMIRPYPRYWALLQKRGLQIVPTNLARIADSFTERDWRDLQVWFNLAWFGYAGTKLYPEIAELKRQGSDFSDVDKQTVLELQQHVLKSVLGYYKAVADRGQIELSTTPFYHPIMPLVYNTDFARRCMPGRDVPRTFSHPEDVRAQLELARDYHAQVFGKRPQGVWPSEGSVCPELVPILQELGYEWVATDEEVLWRSLTAVHPAQPAARQQLYQGHNAQYGDARIGITFRDRALSDFLGFTAARNEPQQAVEYVVGQLEEIARGANREGSVCAIILDGENPWENFADGGETFLRELYQRVGARPGLQPVTFHDYFANHPPQAILTTLHTGSWINADFDIWIGDPEENRAWDLLGETRDFVNAKMEQGECTPEQQARAMREIYAAEGSDWFWWYGGDFVTENDVLFDDLFRVHLQNVYRILGAPMPDVLKEQICRTETPGKVQAPTDLITPQIDGAVTSFYEWTGAGIYESSRDMTTMYQGERQITRIYFGADFGRFYLRADFANPSVLSRNLELRINIRRPQARTIVIPNLRQGKLSCVLFRATTDQADKTSQQPLDAATVQASQILEAAIPITALDWQVGQQVEFVVELLAEGIELECHPSLGVLSLTLPDESFEALNWRV